MLQKLLKKRLVSQTIGSLIFAPREVEKEVTIKIYLVINLLEVRRH